MYQHGINPTVTQLDKPFGSTLKLSLVLTETPTEIVQMFNLFSLDI